MGGWISNIGAVLPVNGGYFNEVIAFSQDIFRKYQLFCCYGSGMLWRAIVYNYSYKTSGKSWQERKMITFWDHNG
jgi:hypothetical protein